MAIKSIIGAAFACLAVVSTNSNAAVVFTDLGSDQYGVSFDLITFIVGTDQSAGNHMIIEDFYQFGSTSNGSDISGSINWSLNGGSSVAIDLVTFNGVWNGGSGQVDNNDLFVNFASDYSAAGATSIEAGDKVTLWTDDMVFYSAFALTPATGSFTAHLLNDDLSIGTATISTVPVPSAVWLFGSGLLGLIGVARRKVRV